MNKDLEILVMEINQLIVTFDKTYDTCLAKSIQTVAGVLLSILEGKRRIIKETKKD